MHITVLAVPHCPHAPLLRERINDALADQDATIESVEVAEEAEAVQLGMYGSPTVLIDGVDPFPVAARATPSLSCRLYRGPDGAVEGAPSVQALRQAFAAAAP